LADGEPGTVSGVRRTWILSITVPIVLGAACARSIPEPGSAATDGDQPADPSVVVPTIPPAPPWLTAITEAGYPRDLLQRGRVNVETTNAGDDALRVTSRELLADHFRSPGPEQRRSLIAAGATVDLQTAHGEVIDCVAETAVSATAVLTYHTDRDPTERVAAVPISDTAILERVRERTCAGRALTDAFDVTFSEPEIDGETFSTTLTLDRRAESARLTLGRGFGTVLFGVERIDAQPSVIAPTDDRATVAIRFDVNRCDPHAVAETTLKYGLQLQIGVGDADPVWADVDIESLHRSLDVLLDRCKARTGG
jgi:hypothetical protein